MIKKYCGFILLNLNNISYSSKIFSETFNIVSDQRFFDQLNRKAVNFNKKKLIILDTLNTQYETYLKLKNIGSNGFSTNIFDGVYHGFSVLHVAFQVLYSLNAKYVHMIGGEFNYKTLKRSEEKKVVSYPDIVLSKFINNYYSHTVPLFKYNNILLTTSKGCLLDY